MYPQFRPPLKFALLWAVNVAILAAIYFLADIEIPMLINSGGIAELILAAGLILAGPETWIFNKLRGE